MESDGMGGEEEKQKQTRQEVEWKPRSTVSSNDLIHFGQNCDAIKILFSLPLPIIMCIYEMCNVTCYFNDT